MKNKLAIFEDYKIRRVYDEETETWYFSVVDIIQALLQQQDFQTARKYWNKLKERLNKEGSQTVTSCHQLKMLADDGKMRLTDVATPETLLRLIQSVPSPKAEPIESKPISRNAATTQRKALLFTHVKSILPLRYLKERQYGQRQKRNHHVPAGAQGFSRQGELLMKKEYTVIIEQDDAGYYVAEVPEFYGCHTQAKSLDELMERVKEAIELCREDDKQAKRPRKHLIGVQRIAV